MKKLTYFPSSRRPLRMEAPVSPVAPMSRTVCLLMMDGDKLEGKMIESEINVVT
jgi:hypothetical protein